MATLAPAAGTLRHQVYLEDLGTPVPDGEGGFTYSPAPLDPAWVFAAIEPATVRAMERLAGGTVSSDATHILTLRYHAGITTKTQITLGGRVFQVTGVVNPEERGISTIAICTERVA